MNQMCFSLTLFTRLAATIDFLMMTPVPQFSTVGTGDVGKEDHSQSLKPQVVKEEWRDESSILRRLTPNFLVLISVHVPKVTPELLQPHSYKPCQSGNADS